MNLSIYTVWFQTIQDKQYSDNMYLEHLDIIHVLSHSFHDTLIVAYWLSQEPMIMIWIISDYDPARSIQPLQRGLKLQLIEGVIDGFENLRTDILTFLDFVMVCDFRPISDRLAREVVHRYADLVILFHDPIVGHCHLEFLGLELNNAMHNL